MGVGRGSIRKFVDNFFFENVHRNFKTDCRRCVYGWTDCATIARGGGETEKKSNIHEIVCIFWSLARDERLPPCIHAAYFRYCAVCVCFRSVLLFIYFFSFSSFFAGDNIVTPVDTTTTWRQRVVPARAISRGDGRPRQIGTTAASRSAAGYYCIVIIFIGKYCEITVGFHSKR